MRLYTQTLCRLFKLATILIASCFVTFTYAAKYDKQDSTFQIMNGMGNWADPHGFLASTSTCVNPNDCVTMHGRQGATTGSITAYISTMNCSGNFTISLKTNDGTDQGKIVPQQGSTYSGTFQVSPTQTSVTCPKTANYSVAPGTSVDYQVTISGLSGAKNKSTKR